MMIRRLISFTLVVALLSSLASPAMAVAHHCAGTAAMAESLRRAAEHEHHHDHDHHHHGSVTSHHDHDHHHDATVHAEEHDHSSLPIGTPSLCCRHDAAGAEAHLDTPTLTTASSQKAVLLAVAVVASIIAPSTLPVHAWEVSFKIGSSPPYLATTSRHTYLLTSSFLI